MFGINNFKKISEWVWELPSNFRADMEVPARVYASEKMLEDIFRDESIPQLVNTATLPGLVKYALVMPDAHEGYGFPIGGVAAIRASDGVISPGGIGFDQNCGVRVLLSDYQAAELKPYLEKLADKIQKEVPSGLGKGRQVKLSIEQIDKILEGGSKHLVEQGYGEAGDIEYCESNGCMRQAQAAVVSDKAKMRGRDQVGTLGSGNHFLEVQKVEEIFDEKVAQTFGLFAGQAVVMVHTGSRGLGHQNCTDYLQLLDKAASQYGIKIPDRELACVPFSSPEGQRFFSAMAAGANYAWANRQMITHHIRKAWQTVFSKGNLSLLYDVAHNIAKVETHEVDGQKMELVVHRKGATRALPAGHPEIPTKHKQVGQPVLIPGSMGTASYILVGSKGGRESWYSTAHGAGRTMSRHAAIKSISGQQIVKDLQALGIVVKCHNLRGIAEEAPQAYKNIDEVVEVVHKAGLSRRVAKLVPLAVIKGE
ncbi:MAG: RtcB family protein [Candidatus Pacebacteria bacterium]|nr:RtcB family protein [Candidatus Paceibacterota bacterium]